MYKKYIYSLCNFTCKAKRQIFFLCYCDNFVFAAYVSGLFYAAEYFIAKLFKPKFFMPPKTVDR